MYSEDDLLPLSGLQHLAFCERQWALIHLEGQWAENRLTAEGRRLHERVDEGGGERRGDLRIARGLPLRSLRLGLSGKADVVEFRRAPGDADGARLPGVAGSWCPRPVEYKRGRPKRDRSDEIQLCAQALCLEEMLGAPVPEGSLFYGTTRRRLDVLLDAGLRLETEDLAARMHALRAAGRTPTARFEPKCERCSLLDLCVPRTTGGTKQVAGYLSRIAREAAMEADREDAP